MSRTFPLIALLLLGCSDPSSPATTRTATEPAKPAAAPTNPKAAKAPAAKASATASKTPHQHALLVGCTTYDNIPRANLVGPAHDVELFRDLLVKHFAFEESPVILAEGQGAPKNRPTRANIEREFKSLADRSQTGDQVVILMGGHGYYVPDDPKSPDDPEPDGLDEVFLPADTMPYVVGAKTIVNSIRDDEIREWLTAIRNKGAFVWIIIDACHSGTMSRAIDEWPREMSSRDLGIPDEVDAAWRGLGEKSRGGDSDPQEHLIDGVDKDGQGRWVAIYGAQTYQRAVELFLPPEAEPAKQKKYGLLTFTVCQVLSRASEPMTYGELIQAVAQQYTAMGREGGPDPLVEGSARDQQVLGEHEWPGRSRLRVENKNGHLVVNGGTIFGVTKGSILAVHKRLNRQPTDEPLGYVKIADCNAIEAQATNCDAEAEAVEENLDIVGYAQLAKIDYSYFGPIVVGIDPLDDKVDARQLSDTVSAVGLPPNSEPDQLLTYQDKPDGANWVVRTKEGKGYLVPSSGWSEVQKTTNPHIDLALPGTEYGPFDLSNEKDLTRLGENIRTIARAQNILRLAPPPDGSKLISGNVNVQLEVRRHKELSDHIGEPLDFTKGSPTVRSGEYLGFHVTNKGVKRVDVTLLYVDAGYGITAWYPRPKQIGDNRIDPGKSVHPPTIRLAKINASPSGLDHMLLAAVESQPQAVDFTWLAQSGVGERASSHPLGVLLNFAVSRTGQRGGSFVEPTEVEETSYVMRTLSWKVPVQTSKFPSEVKAILDHAERFELYSLDPKKPERTKEEFHGMTVILKMSVDEATVRKRLVNVLDNLMAMPKSARCFNPGYAIRATNADQFVELLICFDCGHVGIHFNGKDMGLMPMDVDAGANGVAAFDAVLRDAKR